MLTAEILQTFSNSSSSLVSHLLFTLIHHSYNTQIFFLSLCGVPPPNLFFLLLFLLEELMHIAFQIESSRMWLLVTRRKSGVLHTLISLLLQSYLAMTLIKMLHFSGSFYCWPFANNITYTNYNLAFLSSHNGTLSAHAMFQTKKTLPAKIIFPMVFLILSPYQALPLPALSKAFHMMPLSLI